MSSNDNIKVAIKVRPLIKREKDARQSSQWRIQADTIECLHMTHPNTKYSFDHICDESTTTLNLFDKVAKPIVLSSVNGFNGTIFAYGQTSSGKTHTMLGNADEPGIMVLATRVIFDEIKRRCNRSFIVRISYIEIYNERIFDLFDNRAELKIQEGGNGDIRINCREKLVNSEKEIIDWIQHGNKQRKVGETAMNQGSSRSHTIFSIIIESSEFHEENAVNSEEAVHVSVLNLVDLAGSERADATGATGDRLKEGAAINKSLLSLSVVISKLSDEGEQAKFINYRDSKLTRILQPSLGGNALTSIICTITPAAVEESNYTLGFAMRAKTIKNKPVLNEVCSDAVLSKRYKKQISALEKQLFEERKKLDAREKEIQWRKEKIIHSNAKATNNRRKTWAATNCVNEEIGKDCANDTMVIERPRVEPSHPRFETFGHQIEYSDEQFNDIMDESYGDFHNDTTEANGGGTLLNDRPNIRTCMNIDVLKTPTSLKTTRKSLLAQQAESPFPTEVDKDRRIKALENELLELQQFIKLEKQTELEIKLQSAIDENHQLNDKHIQTVDELAKLKERHDSIEPTCAKLKIECTEALKAKDLAISQCTSIQYEYEQYQLRAKNREAELVSRLDESNNEQVQNELKELISTMQSKLKDMETKLWESEQASKIMENEKKMLLERIEKMSNANRTDVTDLKDKIKKLQNEYDEVSTQLVDSIQENEDLRASLNLAQADMQTAEKKFGAEKEELIVSLAQSELTLKEQEHELEELKKLNSSLSPVKVKYDILSIELKETRNKIQNAESNCEAKLQTMRAELQTKSQLLETIAIENKKLVEELAEQTQKAADIRYARGAFDALAITSTKYIDDLKVAESQLAHFQGKLINSEAEIERLRNEIQSLNNRLASSALESNNIQDFETTIAELQRQIKELEDSNAQLPVSHKQEIDAIQAEKTSLEHQLSQLQSAHDNLEDNQGTLLQICNTCRINTQLTLKDLADQRETLNSLDGIFHTVQEQNSKLADALEEAKVREELLQKTIAELKLQIDDQQTTVAAINAEHSNVMSEILSKNNEYSVRMSELEASNEQLIERAQTLESTSTEQLKEMQEENSKLAEAIDEASGREEFLQKTIADLNSRIDDQQQTISANNSETANAMSEVLSKNNEYSDRMSELEALNEQLIESAKDLQTTNAEKIKEMLEEYSKLAKTVDDSRNREELLQKTIADQNSRIDDQQQTSSASNSENANAMSEILSKNIKNLERISELDVLNGQLMERTKNLELTNIENMEELQTKTAEILSKNNEVAQLNDLNKELSQEINQVNVRNGQLEITNNELQTENQELKPLIEKYLKEISTFSDLQSQLNQQNGEIAELKTTNDKLTNELAICRELNQKQVADISAMADLQTNVKHYIEQIASLESTNKDVQAKSEEQQAIIENKLKEISELSNAIALLESENVQLQIYRSEATTHKDKLDSIKIEADKCQQKFQQQVIEIAQLLKENDALKKSEVQIKNTTNNVKQELEINLERIAALESDKKQLQEGNAQLSNRTAAIEEEMRLIHEKLQEKETALKSTEDKLKMQQSSFESQIDLIKTECEKQLNDLKANLSEKSSILEATANKYEESRSELDTMHLKMDELKTDNTETLARNNEYKTEIKRLMAAIIQMDNLRNELERLRAENDELKCHQTSITISSVEKTVKVQLNDNGKKSSRSSLNTSRDGNSSEMNHLLGENNLLKNKNEKLETEISEIRQSSRLDRKTKRQSLHDDSRRFVFPIDIGCQTEAASELCRCSEHVAMIKKLKQDLAVRTAQLATLKDEVKSKYLQYEIASLNQELSKIKEELNMKKTDCITLRDQLYDAKSKPCEDCAKRSAANPISHPVKIKIENDVGEPERKPVAYGSGIVDAVSLQTLQDKYKMAKDEYKKYKSQCGELQLANRELNGEFNELKQTYAELQVNCQAIEQSHTAIVKKSNKYKEICNNRFKEIDNLKNQIGRLNEKSNEQIEIIQKMQKEFTELQTVSVAKVKEMRELREKYEMIKNIALHRDLEIKKLQKRIEDQDSKKENIPQDFNRNA